MGWYGLDRSSSGQGPVEGSCKHGNEPLDSIKYWEILECLATDGSQKGLSSMELVS
jgi:hypothetical protein